MVSAASRRGALPRRRAAAGTDMSEDANGRATAAEGKAHEGRCKRGRPVREDAAGTLNIGHDVQSR